MNWIPPFSLELTNTEVQAILNWIPNQPSNIRIEDSNYHESKIQCVLQVAPYLHRVEAWAISMYLGPTKYYNSINQALYGDERLEEIEKFMLIARAATIALIKMPPVTRAYITALPQEDGTQTTGLLRRYKGMKPERILPYQVGEVVTESGFISTTYWNLPFGIVQKYADAANTVFEINITPNINGSVGRYVDPLKRKNREGEILFPPGVQFQVLSRVETAESSRVRVSRRVHAVYRR